MKHSQIVLAAMIVAVAMNVSFAGSEIPGVPKGWMATGVDGKESIVGIDPAESSDAHPSLFIENKGQTSEKIVALTQTIDARPWQGKMVELSIEAKHLSDLDGAEIWLRGSDGDGAENHYNSVNSTILGKREWTKYTLKQIVTPQMTRLTIGMGLRDPGKAWMRGLEVKLLPIPAKGEQGSRPTLANLVPLAAPQQSFANLNFSE